MQWISYPWIGVVSCFSSASASKSGVKCYSLFANNKFSAGFHWSGLWSRKIAEICEKSSKSSLKLRDSAYSPAQRHASFFHSPYFNDDLMTVTQLGAI